MKPSSLLASFLVLSVLAGVVSGGCNQTKINKTNPALMVTVRVSIASDGTEGNRPAVADQIGVSYDGRYVAFASDADNLVPNDNKSLTDVFLRDNQTRTLTLVSVSTSNGAANGASTMAHISGDGRYVVFCSFATNLTTDSPPPPAGVRQVYVRDMQLGVTTLVSRATGASGAFANVNCQNPKISNDGNFVVFDTAAENLDGTPGGGVDSDALTDVYRRKWIDGLNIFPTELVSFASGCGNPPLTTTKGNGASRIPAISGDGRFVAFESDATNLVLVGGAGGDGGPDLNAQTDVFVRDMDTNRTVRCSVELPGTIFPGALPLAGPSTSATITLDGSMVGFRSTSALLSPIAQDQAPNIFVRGLWGTAQEFTEVLSIHTSGATGGQNCNKPSICGDGSKLVWQSPSPALVNGDTNGALDIFLRDRTLAQTSRVSVQTFGGQLDGDSEIPAYSADGRYIIFWSRATNGVDNDTNGAADIYMRGPPFK
jgi:Tol biopolymer transport system component